MPCHQLDDILYYCTRCGQSWFDIQRGSVPLTCQATLNVVGISHRVRGGLLRKIAREVLDANDDTGEVF